MKNLKKIFIMLMIVLTICACDYNKKDEPKEPAINEEETKTKEPVNITTDSGIALIGMIKKENDAYYFVLERPINLILDLFANHEEGFDNVYKIKMLDDNLYGINKDVYLNELVTITGIVNNPRGAGILNLIPYTIRRGKMIDENSSISEISVPDENVIYDETKIPSKMKSIVKDNKYEYNIYKLSDETLKTFGTDFIDFYISFVDAYVNYESTIECDNKTYFYNLITLIEHEFPVFNADAKIDTINGYDKDKKTITIEYTKTKEEHDKIVNTFINEANKFLNGVTYDMNDSMKAQVIYHNLSSSVKYDYDALDDFSKSYSIYVYLNHTGICHSFADAYLQLLNQVNIESTMVSGAVSNSTIGHAWTAIKIDGEWYFADPTYEVSYENGNYYKYFGINLEQRLNNGEFLTDRMYVGRYKDISVKEFADFNKVLQIKN